MDFFKYLGSTLNPSIHLMKTSLVSSSEKGTNNRSSDKYIYSGYDPSFRSEINELKVEDNTFQRNEEPYYNRMMKKPSINQSKNRNVSKENWNSLYSDVDYSTNSTSCYSFKQSTRPTIKPHEQHVENSCLMQSDVSLNLSNGRPSGSDPSYVKVPWQEYENNDSNVVDITHWIMNTLSSAMKLRFLDLAGLETYISQIILLIKLITTTSGVNNRNPDSNLTSSLLAIPSASSSDVEISKIALDGQTRINDRNGNRLKEKRFSDIVGVIKGKKHLKKYSSNG